ncbi:hypothetical protein [Amphibacillus sediminis]|uniref:hypothetical protein n=1 Tax=Amphibacillus sediminis TaxID=360185 RepID=UPI0008371A14|nr:hypothetical protein [Amphibacillus sediminis]
MEDLIVPVITFFLIIGGSLFKNYVGNQSEKEQQAKRRPMVNQPKSTMQQRQTMRSETPNRKPNQVKNQAKSSSEVDKKAQLEQLKQTLTDKREQKIRHLQSVTRNSSRKSVSTNRSRDNAAKSKSFNIKRNISGKGLATSVVMAEVLGPPRSKKPYSIRSVR